MSDFTTRAREAAKREAQSKYGDDRRGDLLPSDYVRGGEKIGFRFGFTAAVSRLPSEEEIAESLLVSLVFTDEASRAWANNAARAVRELIERRVVGEQ